MRALCIVDLQNDFMPEGPLGVSGAHAIVPIINRFIPAFSLVIATQDWHPKDHVSFAANHPGKKPGDRIPTDFGEQILWPVHCVQNTRGAELVSDLNREKIESVFYKGTDKEIDSYSAFFDNARRRATGLAPFLESKGAAQLYFAGLATDYCVLYSALDAIDLGFEVFVVADACRAVNLRLEDEQLAFAAIAAKGGKIISSKDI
ncbi:MAG: bifunctional nicotinamidase/pyrazinamidase [Chlamydiota bacterium]